MFSPVARSSRLQASSRKGSSVSNIASAKQQRLLLRTDSLLVNVIKPNLASGNVESCFVVQPSMHGLRLTNYLTNISFSVPSSYPFYSTLASTHSTTSILLVDSNWNATYYDDLSQPLAFNFVLEQSSSSDSPKMIKRLENIGWVVASELGHMWLIERLDLNHKQQVNAPIISKKLEHGSSAGILSFIGVLSPAAVLVVEPIIAITEGKAQKSRFIFSSLTFRVIFALSNDSIQQWTVMPRESHQFIYQAFVLDSIRERIAHDYRTSGKVELIDLDFSRESTLVILVQAYVNATAHFYLVTLGIVKDDSGSLPIKDVVFLEHTIQLATFSSRPRLALSNGGTAFIFFQDCIEINCRSRKLRDLISLKPFTNQTDTLIDVFHVDKSRLWGKVAEEEPDLAYMVFPRVGVVAIQFSPTHYNPQAVFFTKPDEYDMSPIAFTLPIGDLDIACVDLTHRILNNVCKYIPGVMDPTALLNEKQTRMGHIIGYLSSIDLVDRLSLYARYTLCFNNERVVAAFCLWQYVNLQSNAVESPRETILSRAIVKYMGPTMQPDFTTADAIREFFLGRIENIADLIDGKLIPLPDLSKSFPESHCRDLFEANKIIITILDASVNYRANNASSYSILASSDYAAFGVLDLNAPIDPWTATNTILDRLAAHFERTVSYLSSVRTLTTNQNDAMDYSYDSSSLSSLQPSNVDLANQLPSLATLMIHCFSQRIAYLQNFNSVDNDEIITLKSRIASFQSELFEPLSRLWNIQSTFYLAEKHMAFNALVTLTFEYYEDSSINEKLGLYIDRFGQAFADVLYATFIEQKKYSALFDDSVVVPGCDAHVDAFLSKSQMPQLSWIQDLKMERYAGASDAISSSLSGEKSTSKRKTAASLAILFHTAGMDEWDDLKVQTPVFQDHFFIIDNSNLQGIIMTHLQSLLAPPAPSNSEYANLILACPVFAPIIGKRMGFAKIFSECVDLIMNDVALDVVQLVDMFTLTIGAPVEWCLSAVQLLNSRIENFSEMEFDVLLKTTWRRAYLATDWDALNTLQKQKSNASFRDFFVKTPVFSLFTNLKDAPELIVYPKECRGNLALLVGDAALIKDYSWENECLSKLISTRHFCGYVEECRRIACDMADVD